MAFSLSDTVRYILLLSLHLHPTLTGILTTNHNFSRFHFVSRHGQVYFALLTGQRMRSMTCRSQTELFFFVDCISGRLSAMSKSFSQQSKIKHKKTIIITGFIYCQINKGCKARKRRNTKIMGTTRYTLASK